MRAYVVKSADYYANWSSSSSLIKLHSAVRESISMKLRGIWDALRMGINICAGINFQTSRLENYSDSIQICSLRK